MCGGGGGGFNNVRQYCELEKAQEVEPTKEGARLWSKENYKEPKGS